MPDKICKNCKWAVNATAMKETNSCWDMSISVLTSVLICHARPPQVTTSWQKGQFPIVDENDFCGLFEEKTIAEESSVVQKEVKQNE